MGETCSSSWTGSAKYPTLICHTLDMKREVNLTNAMWHGDLIMKMSNASEVWDVQAYRYSAVSVRADTVVSPAL